MTIHWECEDGYAGGSAPQSFKLSDDEITECENVETALKLIEESTQEDFQQKVSWHYLRFEDTKAEVERLFASKKEEQ